jgi:hypothetical protein
VRHEEAIPAWIEVTAGFLELIERSRLSEANL